MDATQFYNNALSINSGIYGSIVSGIQNLMQQQMAAEQGVIAGYGTLGSQVQKTIQNVDASQLQAAKDLYTQQMGKTQQQAISAGLGNSTVLASLNRGNTLDYSKATTAIENQFAQLKAGYQSQIGLAGLNYQGQAINANSALGLAGLSLQAGFKVPWGTGGFQQPGYGGGGAGNVYSSPNPLFDPNWGSNYGGGGYDPTGTGAGYSYGSGIADTRQYPYAGGGGGGQSYGSYAGNYGNYPYDTGGGGGGDAGYYDESAA